MFISEDYIYYLVTKYGAGIVGVLTALESIGIPLPAEMALLAVAIYAGTTHSISICAVIGAAVAGAIVGDNIGYRIGRSVGYPLLKIHGHRIGLHNNRLVLGRYLFRQYGMRMVLFGRFVAVLRTLTAILAGASQMQWQKFLVANAIGAVLWASTLGLGAYLLGERMAKMAAGGGFVLLLIAMLGMLSMILFIRRREAVLLRRTSSAAGTQDR